MDFRRYSSKYPHFLGQEVPGALMDIITESRPGTLLDVGCGDGSLLHGLIGSGLVEGWRLCGLDASEERVERVRRLGLNVQCLVGNAATLDGIDDASIDLVVCTQVIEHVPSDEAMLAAFTRVLAPEGTAYITTVFKRRHAVYWHRCNGRWALDPTHVREYVEDRELLDRLVDAGLRPVRSRKTPLAFTPVDPIMRLLHAPRDAAIRHGTIHAARKLRIPIPGYYNWEIVAAKAKPAGYELPEEHGAQG